MFSKVLSRSAVSVLGVVFAVAVFIGFSGNSAIAQDLPEIPGELFEKGHVLNGCGDNADFTTDFLIDRCKFKTKGRNPYFILLPGWQFVLEDDEEWEREIVNVLYKTEKIDLYGRKINTRVIEERAIECEEDWEGCKTVEISLNWVAICDQTNDVYYFGEDSRDCLDEDGFRENDECDEEENTGSWRAGKDGARPGILMPGTFLLGAKYFQEIAVNIAEPEESAIDRGEHVLMGEDVEVPAGEWEDCVVVLDTNPVEEPDGGCSEDDQKTYCPGIGIVQDQDLELVDYGFVNKKGKPIKKKWRPRHYRSRH